MNLVEPQECSSVNVSRSFRSWSCKKSKETENERRRRNEARQHGGQKEQFIFSGGDLEAFFQTKCTCSSAHLLSPPISVCKRLSFNPSATVGMKGAKLPTAAKLMTDCLPASFPRRSLTDSDLFVTVVPSPHPQPFPNSLQKKLMVSCAGSCEGSPCLFPMVENGAWSRPRSRVINNLTEEEAEKRRKSYQDGGEKTKQKVAATHQPKT